MINATELKNGVAFLHYGKPYQVVKYSLIKMGRGGAIVKVNARNLENGSIVEISYSSNNSVDEANTQKKSLQYLYKDTTTAYFMDPTSFEQIEIPLEVLGNQISYIREGENVSVFFWENKALSVELPVGKTEEQPPVIRAPQRVKSRNESRIERAPQARRAKAKAEPPFNLFDALFGAPKTKQSPNADINTTAR